MKIYEKIYEREGNDSWLIDYIEINKNQMGLYLYHKKNHKGWCGDINENNTIDLFEYDIEKSQKMIDKYLYDNNLEDHIVIYLSELLEKI